MILHFASLNTRSTIIFTLDLKFNAIILNMLIHVIERKHQAAFQDTVYNSERAVDQLVLVDIFPKDFTANLTVGTGDRSVFALG